MNSTGDGKITRTAKRAQDGHRAEGNKRTKHFNVTRNDTLIRDQIEEGQTTCSLIVTNAYLGHPLQQRSEDLPENPTTPKIDANESVRHLHSKDSSSKLIALDTQHPLSLRQQIPQQQEPISASTSSQLCAQCEKLDLDKSFEEASKEYQKVKEGSITLEDDLKTAPDGRYFYKDAKIIHHFQDRLSRPSKCQLCCFFRSLRALPERFERYKLLAFRSSESWMFQRDELQDSGIWNEIKDTVFMAVVPDDEHIPPDGHEENWLEKDIPAAGAIYRLQADESRDTDPNVLLRARELFDKADLSLVQVWLNTCRKNHRSACGPQKSREPITKEFRVINCTASPPVVEKRPWGTAYAALSYVWGSDSADKKDWPATVLDATVVTRELGLQYLWVDRVCINQSDDAEKAYLISRMDIIYEQADFTIVAAAGSGASHGLPGVRSTLRKPQPKYKLDSGSLLLSMLPDPRYDILQSDYWTRGWTYQEGILSRRRIVFTQHQVYWECCSMATHESANMPLFVKPTTSDEDSELRMADFMLTGIFKGDAYSGGSLSDQDDLVIIKDDDYRRDYGFPIRYEATARAQLRGLDEHIRAFSKRKLSHDTDALPAFLGILGMYKQNKLLHLLHGIPIWMDRIAGGETGPHITFALSIASWYHRAGSDFHLFSSELYRRRDHLPSWTWAGWDGPVSWRAPPNYEHSAYMSDIVMLEGLRFLWAANIYLLNPDRPTSIWLLNKCSIDDLNRENPTLIKIKSPHLLKYFYRERTKKAWRWARIAGRSGRERYQAESPDWDKKWHRIAGRLYFIGLSVQMTEDEWADKHHSGELISVLVFAGTEATSVHARARFVTLRKVASVSAGERWERIGILSLIIPDVSLCNCVTVQDFLNEIPVVRKPDAIVIQ